jgi:hypothetical protein
MKLGLNIASLKVNLFYASESITLETLTKVYFQRITQTEVNSAMLTHRILHSGELDTLKAPGQSRGQENGENYITLRQL